MFFFPLVHSGWLPLFLDDNVDDAILERVWWTGFLEGNRWPIKPIPQASSAPLTKMRAKCIWEALDAINKVRLCFLTQNYTNNQSEIQNNASSAFWDKMWKKMLAKPNNAKKKSASTIGKSQKLTDGLQLLTNLNILCLKARRNV